MKLGKSLTSDSKEVNSGIDYQKISDITSLGLFKRKIKVLLNI